MWGSKNKGKMTRVDTLVGEGTCVAGDLNFSGGLHVDGTVRGTVAAESAMASPSAMWTGTPFV